MTMSEQKDNLELEEYLKGNSFISRRYRKEAMAEPSPHLDAAIIAAAKKAAENKKTVSGPFTAGWYIPLSLAAVVVISFSVVFKIYDRDGQQIFSDQAELKSKIPAAELDSAMGQDAGEASGMMGDEIRSKEAIEAETQSGSSSLPAMREDYSAPAPEPQKKNQNIEEIGVDIYKDELSGSRQAIQEPAAMPAPTESAVELSDEKLRKQKSDTAVVTGAAAGLVPEQWFEIINRLWFDGDEEGAYRGLKNFLADYPDYPLDELKNNLPQDLDLSAITGKLDKTTEGTE